MRKEQLILFSRQTDGHGCTSTPSAILRGRPQRWQSMQTFDIKDVLCKFGGAGVGSAAELLGLCSDDWWSEGGGGQMSRKLPGLPYQG